MKSTDLTRSNTQVVVLHRHRGIVIGSSIMLSMEMICMVMTEATDKNMVRSVRASQLYHCAHARYGMSGVCVNVLDTKPYVFKFLKVTLKQVEKFWRDLYHLAVHGRK